MFVAEKGVPLAVTDVALNIVLSEAYDTVSSLSIFFIFGTKLIDLLV